MRCPEPAAEPFGLADGWGLGLASYDSGWFGHDGNADGTACYLRIEPASGRVIAFTSNASTGAHLWSGLGLHCGESGPDLTDAVPAPAACAGSYVNGDVEFVVSVRHGRGTLIVDDEAPVPMTFHSGLVFSVPDPQTRRPVLGGRFLSAPGIGRIHALQIGGRLASRSTTARESATSRIA
jgi:hypothetical protein